jgi:WD40 repeat protein
VQIFLPSCASSMEFHPVNPSVISVGLHSGEIALVDIFTSETNVAKEEPQQDETIDLLGRGNRSEFKMSDLGYFIDGSGHVNEVTGLKWLQLSQAQLNELVSKNKNPSTCCLLTSSKDGYICLWSANTSNTRLTLEKKFIAWSDYLSDDIRIGNKTHLNMKEIGILGLSCCKDDPFSFICMTYGGFVFQGNLEGEVEACNDFSTNHFFEMPTSSSLLNKSYFHN